MAQVRNRQLYGVGETVLDVVFKNDQPQAAVPGGSAFNAMISLGRSVGVAMPGIPIRMVTETGDDHIGDIVVRFLADNHVLTDCVTRNPGTQTHISMAFLDDKNDAQYEFYKDHAHASLRSESVEHVRFQADDVLLTSSFFAINPVIREYTRAIFAQAHAVGAIMYYDVNFRRSHIGDLPQVMGNITENMDFADIVRGSTEDFDILYGTSDPREVYDRHVKAHCPVFICTDGAGPLTVITPSYTATYPVSPVKTVSTIGAGDNFNAGVVCAIVEQGLGKADLANAGKEVWDNLVARGLQFSAEVCQSFDNYISAWEK